MAEEGVRLLDPGGTSAVPGGRAVALHSFDPSMHRACVRLRVGQIVGVHDCLATGWCEVATREEQGWAPASFLMDLGRWNTRRSLEGLPTSEPTDLYVRVAPSEPLPALELPGSPAALLRPVKRHAQAFYDALSSGVPVARPAADFGRSVQLLDNDAEYLLRCMPVSRRAVREYGETRIRLLTEQVDALLALTKDAGPEMRLSLVQQLNAVLHTAGQAADAALDQVQGEALDVMYGPGVPEHWTDESGSQEPNGVDPAEAEPSNSEASGEPVPKGDVEAAAARLGALIGPGDSDAQSDESVETELCSGACIEADLQSDVGIEGDATLSIQEDAVRPGMPKDGAPAALTEAAVISECTAFFEACSVAAESRAIAAERTARSPPAVLGVQTRPLATPPLESPTADEELCTLSPSEAIACVTTVNDQLLSVIAAFIGHVHTFAAEDSAPSYHRLLVMLDEATSFGNALLAIVRAVQLQEGAAWLASASLERLAAVHRTLRSALTAMITATRRMSAPGQSGDAHKALVLSKAAPVLRIGNECLAAVLSALEWAPGSLSLAVIGPPTVRQSKPAVAPVPAAVAPVPAAAPGPTAEARASEPLAAPVHASQVRPITNALEGTPHSMLGALAPPARPPGSEAAGKSTPRTRALRGEMAAAGVSPDSSGDSGSVASILAGDTSAAESIKTQMTTPRSQASQTKPRSDAGSERGAEQAADLTEWQPPQPRASGEQGRTQHPGTWPGAEAYSYETSMANGMYHGNPSTWYTCDGGPHSQDPHSWHGYPQGGYPHPHSQNAYGWGTYDGSAAANMYDASGSADYADTTMGTQEVASAAAAAPAAPAAPAEDHAAKADGSPARSSRPHKHRRRRKAHRQNRLEDEVVYSADDGRVLGGTLPGLVEVMTQRDAGADPAFTRAFLLCFRLFTTAEGLGNALLVRFRSSRAGGAPDGGPIRQRIVNFFCVWLEHHWNPTQDSGVLPAVSQLLHSGARDEQVAHLCTRLGALLRRRRRLGTGAQHMVISADDASGEARLRCVLLTKQGEQLPLGLSGNDAAESQRTDATQLYSSAPNGTRHLAAPSPVLARSLVAALRQARSPAAVPVLEFDPLELARQITVVESRLFCSILPDELLHRTAAYSGSHDRSPAPHVRAMGTLTTQLTHWIGECILAVEELKKRAQVLRFFIRLGDAALALQNFNLLMGVQGALNSCSITRLRRTWHALSSKTRAAAERQRAVVDPARNFAAYRRALNASRGPALPFLGLVLTDITFCLEGNPATRTFGTGPRRMINFVRYMRVAHVVSGVQRRQEPYVLLEQPEVQRFLQTLVAQSKAASQGSHAAVADALYQRSLQLEPRERPKPALTLSSSGSPTSSAAGSPRTPAPPAEPRGSHSSSKSVELRIPVLDTLMRRA